MQKSAPEKLGQMARVVVMVIGYCLQPSGNYRLLFVIVAESRSNPAISVIRDLHMLPARDLVVSLLAVVFNGG